ncbi:hypothetical protein [Endozoicomonas acroporae]|uniref:hypothetical protein n=1 Tax=Endozoicomonas acroporae TaxID=1701104 RepID=UPI0013D2C4B3|nr:hypothetical protein [Endozoicomonas acroporae]
MKEPLLSDKGLTRLVDDLKGLSSAANEPACQPSQAARLDRQQIIANQKLRSVLVEREQQKKQLNTRRLVNRLKIYLKNKARV